MQSLDGKAMMKKAFFAVLVIVVLVWLTLLPRLLPRDAFQDQECVPGGASYLVPAGDTYTTITIPDCE